MKRPCDIICFVSEFSERELCVHARYDGWLLAVELCSFDYQLACADTVGERSLRSDAKLVNRPLLQKDQTLTCFA
jgi:hypothetical protein